MNSEKNTQSLTSLQKSLVQKPDTDPTLFFDRINELGDTAHLLCAITAASEIGLFDLLFIPQSREQVCRSCPRREMIEPLIDILIDGKILTEHEGLLSCSKIPAEYLSLSSPYSQVSYLKKMIWHLSQHWINLADIIRTGPVLYSEDEYFSQWSLPSMAANALCGRLQEVTQKIAELPGFFDSKTMIDLGGGHGLYAMSLARLNPNLKAVVFDLPGVAPLTRSYIRTYGMEEQVSVVVGDFFSDSFGTGFDIILSSSNPSGKIPAFIPVIGKALNSRGYFITIQSGSQSGITQSDHRLEWELWGFSGVDTPKSSWGKKEDFLTPAYLQSLADEGLEMISVTSIPDPYLHGYTVTMAITQKRE